MKVSEEQQEWMRTYLAWVMTDRTCVMEEAELRSGIVAAWVVPLSGIED